jgi:hypothetical protein
MSNVVAYVTKQVRPSACCHADYWEGCEVSAVTLRIAVQHTCQIQLLQEVEYIFRGKFTYVRIPCTKYNLRISENVVLFRQEWKCKLSE